MKDALKIKWPWEMVWFEHIDDIIAQIKDALPPDHELQNHKLFPGIKWNGRPIFIVDDDTTNKCVLLNFEKMRRCKQTKFKVPTIIIFRDRQEIAEMINRDHALESSKYSKQE